ncbi:MAG: histidine phosphatase family protein [bacterium]|nr:histidine phosphatase family protein [bacterium]
MKWPRTLVLATPGESESQFNKRYWLSDPDFREFLKYVAEDPENLLIDGLAQTLKEKFGLPIQDSNSPLTSTGIEQVRLTALELQKRIEAPERIFVAPYTAALETVAIIQKHWPATRNASIIKDGRLQSQDLGRAVLYHDPRIFMVLNQEQREMIGFYGPYHYRFPQGESIFDVRERTRGSIGALVREHGGNHIMIVGPSLVTHCLEANFLDNMPEEEFVEFWRQERDGNGHCHISAYRNTPKSGKERLEPIFRNQTFWQQS